MAKTWRIFEAWQWASSFLEQHGREVKAAELLLCHHLQMDRTTLFQNMRETMPATVVGPFVEDIHAHADGSPVQHLIGEEMFYGRPFSVNEDVLIPRPETEELVALVLESGPAQQGASVVDVGTGSGAIAVTLALENPRLQVSAVDISDAALRTAKGNAQRHEANIAFLQGDLLAPLIEKGEKKQIIVANPPYIRESEYQALDPLVRDHEPRTALAAGEDGLAFYRRLTAQIPDVIQTPGFVAFEVGAGQSSDILQLLEMVLGPQAKLSVHKDINGKDRMVAATIAG